MNQLKGAVRVQINQYIYVEREAGKIFFFRWSGNVNFDIPICQRKLRCKLAAGKISLGKSWLIEEVGQVQSLTEVVGQSRQESEDRTYRLSKSNYYNFNCSILGTIYRTRLLNGRQP